MWAGALSSTAVTFGKAATSFENVPAIVCTLEQVGEWGDLTPDPPERQTHDHHSVTHSFTMPATDGG
jgi:hypothetical protein